MTKWKTDNPGVTNSNQIKLRFQNNISLNYRVNWGDGIINQNVTTSEITHTYATPGTYTVRLSGTLNSLKFEGGHDRLKLLSIEQWGTIEWETFSTSFEGCENLVLNATDRPRLGFGCNLFGMFKDCKSFNTNINSWDVSLAGIFNSMFMGCTSFNQPLNNWNVIGATSFSRMFEGCVSFNQPLNNWVPTSLIRTFRMFKGATSFNSPLWTNGSSALTDMSYMFDGAITFNQPIQFVTFSCQNMDNMFYGASAFNQSLASFDIRNLTRAIGMLDSSNMSIANYEGLLTSWSTKLRQSNVVFGAETIKYCSAGAAARASLISNDGWDFYNDQSAITTFAVAPGSNSQVTTCVGGTMPAINLVASNIGVTAPSATGLPNGVSIAVNGLQLSITGVPTSTGVFNYTVSGAGLCGLGSISGTITVQPRASVISVPSSDVLSQTICPGASIVPINWGMSTGISSTRFTGLPQGITGSFQNNNLTLSGTPGVTGSFTMIAYYTDICGEQSVSATLVVRQAASIQVTSGVNSQFRTACAGQSISAITFFSNTGQAQVSGLPPGFNASQTFGNITISGASSIIGTYNYSITALSDCGNSAPFQGSISIIPSPSVNVGPALQPICAGTSTGPLGGSASGLGVSQAVWSDGLAGGSFTNNSGTTPELASYTPASGFTGAVSLRLTAAGQACSTTVSKALTVQPTGVVTWLGGTSTWNAASNWSSGSVPSSCADVVIPSGRPNNPVVPAGNFRVKSLSVQSGAVITISTGANLEVAQ
ncbi:MAG: BspA family leucine-rich repeat surface protein [Ferruginibacter sp.]